MVHPTGGEVNCYLVLTFMVSTAFVCCHGIHLSLSSNILFSNSA